MKLNQASTQRNLRTLEADGFRIIGPDSGWQACRTEGAGRMVEPEVLLEEARTALKTT